MLSGWEYLLVLAVALAYGVIRLLPRLIAGYDAYTSPQQLKQELDHNEALLLLDVRSSTEFTEQPGHIPGAINVPLAVLKQRLTDESFVRRYLEHSIIAVCQTDARAAFAVRTLRRHGFRRVRVLSGGIAAWGDQGYPVVSGAQSRGSDSG